MKHPTYDASDPKAGQPVLVGDVIFSPGDGNGPDVRGTVEYVRAVWVNTVEGQGFIPSQSRIFSTPPAPAWKAGDEAVYCSITVKVVAVFTDYVCISWNGLSGHVAIDTLRKPQP